MNVVISNKYKSLLDSLNIEVMKNLNGEFEAEDIISQFQNFFFQRMILDITAIKNYKDIQTLQKLSLALDMDKVIILLDDSIDNINDYLSNLVSIGIYNFTKNIEGVMYLYNNPNSYRDVAHIQQISMHSTASAPQPAVQTEVRVEYVNQPVVVTNERIPTKIIGIKNVTKQTGATTLAYMMKKQLESKYNTIAVEVGKDDFKFFNDKNLFSCSEQEISGFISKNNDKEVIIIDLNDSNEAVSFCHEILYLVEPSVIKLNKLMFLNPKALQDIKNKKIILNQSLLTPKDVLEFEYEAGIKIYYNMPPLDEREKSIFQMNKFLFNLGFVKLSGDEEAKKKFNILGLFK